MKIGATTFVQPTAFEHEFDIPPRTVNVPGAFAKQEVRIGAATSDDTGSGWFVAKPSSKLARIEQEPNDRRESANSLAMDNQPVIDGRLGYARDRDFYQFAAKANEKIRFRLLGRRWGSSADLYWQVQDADGKVLTKGDDVGLHEGVVEFNPTSDGDYFLMLEDLHYRGGPSLAYRLSCEVSQPEFLLSVDAATFNAPSGGVFGGKLTCQRKGFQEPILLAVQGIPGSTISPKVIDKDKEEVDFRVTLPDDYQPGELRELTIIGAADLTERRLRATANCAAALKETFNGLNRFPRRP